MVHQKELQRKDQAVNLPNDRALVEKCNVAPRPAIPHVGSSVLTLGFSRKSGRDSCFCIMVLERTFRYVAVILMQ